MGRYLDERAVYVPCWWQQFPCAVCFLTNIDHLLISVWSVDSRQLLFQRCWQERYADLTS